MAFFATYGGQQDSFEEELLMAAVSGELSCSSPRDSSGNSESGESGNGSFVNRNSNDTVSCPTSPSHRPFITAGRELPPGLNTGGHLPLGTTPPTISHFEMMAQQRFDVNRIPPSVPEQIHQDGPGVVSRLLSTGLESVSETTLENAFAGMATAAMVTSALAPLDQTTPVISVTSASASASISPVQHTHPFPFSHPHHAPQAARPMSPLQHETRAISPRPSRPPSVDWTLRLFRLEDFVFGKTVGTGTFGRVRLAKLRDHDKFFAMKIMRKEDIVRLHQIDHIYSEKYLLSRLSCPFIIRLYGTFQDAQHLYMLLEYAIGGELFTYLRRAGRFPTGTTRFYAAEIILALEYLHGLNIVYRDLKPENLLLDARGHIKIADFGFAKIIPDNRTCTLCGTPEYLAPEIILGRGHGRPVDWWALGILIYEMLAGFPPFYDETPFLIYEKILAGRLEFPPHFDPLLIDLLTGLLQPDPQRRLGCGAGGAADVRSHPWFHGVNWDALSRRLIPAPFTPPVRHAGDTSNFEDYPEDDVLADPPVVDRERDRELAHIFSEF